jgi:hypothetical protein
MSWLSSLLAPLKLLWNSVEQTRDDRIDFTDGFIATQVPDADGVNVLTLSTEVGAATVTPTADKVVLRNGSGVIYGTTIVATTYSFPTPRTISYKEPIRVTDVDKMDPVTGWILNSSQELEAADVSLQWLAEITPPVGSNLKTISVVYTPPGAHPALPGDQPSIELFTIAEGTAPTLYDSVQDNAADLLAYEAKRTLTLTLGTPITIVSGTRYWLQFNAETSTNAAAGTALHVPAKWTAEITNL